MKEKIKCMKDLELFRGLNKEDKEHIIRLAQGRMFSKNEIMFSEGDKADKIFLVRTGKIILFKVSQEGKEIILDILEEGDIIGENTIFENMTHTFSAKAIDKTYVCTCAQKDFMTLLSNVDISLKIIQSLVEKLNNNTQTMSDYVFYDVKERVLSILARLSKKHGSLTDDGIKLDIPLTHQDIANLVNASRVMVTNTINVLKDEGKLEVQKKHFIIKENQYENVTYL